MDSLSRLSLEATGQLLCWLKPSSAKPIFSRHASSLVYLPVRASLSALPYYSATQGYGCRRRQPFTTYVDLTRKALLYHMPPSPSSSTYLFGKPAPLLACYKGEQLQARPYSSTAPTAEYFANQELSTFQEFSAGLRAYEKSHFLESSQLFRRLYDLVKQINQPRHCFSTDTTLLVCGCLAASLFREGAYDRAEQVSKEMLTKIHLQVQSAPHQLSCLEAYRAFATIAAASAAFECEAQRSQRHAANSNDPGVCRERAGERTSRKREEEEEEEEIFLPTRRAMLCLNSAMRTQQQEPVSCSPRACICMWELRILQDCFDVFGAPRPSGEEKTKRDRIHTKVHGVLYDFLRLVEAYNAFVVRVYTLLNLGAADRQSLAKRHKDMSHSYLATAESLLTEAAAVLERFEREKREGKPPLGFETASHQYSDATYPPTDGAGRCPSRPSNHAVASLSEEIMEDEYAAQILVGLLRMFRGLGACLIRLSTRETPDSFHRFFSEEGKNSFSMGQAALKKGLGLCKKHTEIQCRPVKGAMLAELATSFRCTGNAVISEGLFSSALSEFAASTGLRPDLLVEAAAGRVSQAQKQHPVDTALPYQQRTGDDDRHEPLTLGAYPLTFADRFDYASAMLQYSFLLTKWEGREFEAQRMKTAAAELLKISHTVSTTGSRRCMLESWLLSLLWKPPVNLALCLTAGLHGNSSWSEKKTQPATAGGALSQGRRGA